MKVTKVMLEEKNLSLQRAMTTLKVENDALFEQTRYLKSIIQTYSGMTPLIIAAERISEALAQSLTITSRR